MSTTTAAALDFYAKHGAALFPIPKGQKNPTGIVASWQKDHSKDPAVWQSWSETNADCNFGVYAAGSGWIIMDTDASGDRNEAWAMRCALLTEWGMDPAVPPHVQSARGGWHDYFKVPPGTDPASLRQPDAIKKRINIRCQGFTVAAGSYYDGTLKNEASGPYLLLSDARPHPAPEALIKHCTRAPRAIGAAAITQGTMDRGDVAALLAWLVERDAFAAYEDWVAAGMALKLEFGDSGLELWQLTHDASVDGDTEFAKWNSFSTDAGGDAVTIASLIDRARKLGWRGTIRTSTSKMFDGVAALAAASGASLSPDGLIGQTAKVIGRIGQPILDMFIEGTKDSPSRPGNSSNYPALPPESMGDHPLFDILNTAIARIAAMAESPKTFRQQRVWGVLKVLRWTHEATYDALVDFITVRGAILSPGELAKHNKNFEAAIVNEQRAAATGPRGFVAGTKNLPDPQVSDNVGIFLGMAGARLQYDEFTKRSELAESETDTFTRVDQYHLDKYWYLAKSSNYGFHPSKELFRTGWSIEARTTRTYDSLRDRVDALALKWDRMPRLDYWLTRCVGVANDPYHVAVGRNLIGGMVRRARYPGCVQAETVIFISPTQGTGKSTLCKILALEPDWYLGKFKLGGTEQNSLPLLAGKWIVEMSELAGLTKTDFEDVKSLLTQTKDEYVAKYEAIPTEHLRRCCFIGTSNLRQPLADPSGNRRFLPVHVPGMIDLVWLQQNVEQLIGECAVRDAAGESFAIPEEIWTITTAQQEAARNMSPVEEAINEWFDRPEPALYVASSDVRRALDMAGLHATARYGVFMEKLGWFHRQAPNRGRDRIWMKGGVFADAIHLEPSQSQANGRVEMRMRPKGTTF